MAGSPKARNRLVLLRGATGAVTGGFGGGHDTGGNVEAAEAGVGGFKVAGIAIGCIEMKEGMLGQLVTIDHLEVLLAVAAMHLIGFVGDNLVCIPKNDAGIGHPDSGMTRRCWVSEVR